MKQERKGARSKVVRLTKEKCISRCFQEGCSVIRAAQNLTQG